MIPGERLTREFYIRDVLEVAPELIGKNMVVRMTDGDFAKIYHN